MPGTDLKEDVCFGDDFILLLFADIVTEIVEILGGRLFIRMSQDIVDNGFRNLTSISSYLASAV